MNGAGLLRQDRRSFAIVLLRVAQARLDSVNLFQQTSAGHHGHENFLFIALSALQICAMRTSNRMTIFAEYAKDFDEGFEVKQMVDAGAGPPPSCRFGS